MICTNSQKLILSYHYDKMTLFQIQSLIIADCMSQAKEALSLSQLVDRY